MRFSKSRYIRKVTFPLLLLLFLCLFGVYNIYVGYVPELMLYNLAKFPRAHPIFAQTHLFEIFDFLRYGSLLLGWMQLAIFLLTGLLGLRRPLVIRLHLFAWWAQVSLLFPRIILFWRIPSILFAKEYVLDDERNQLWYTHGSVLLLLVLMLSIWYIVLHLREIRNIFWHEFSTEPEWGDRILENIRTHGATPHYRKAWYLSVFSHVMVIIIIPWLLTLRGCVEPYRLPKGAGMPAVMKVMRVKQKKKKKKKRLILNMNSPIIFHIPKIDESKIFEEMEKVTAQTYTANTQRGRLGSGKGPKGGWPTGMENARVRFIRLQYRGGDWDQDMGQGADYNMLIKFREMTGFNIAKMTESIPISSLRKFPKGKAPPFVYITGEKGIRISGTEKKILRNYLITEGGMLFADNGGGSFDWAFRNMMRTVLPEYNFITIAKDDPIFRQPYVFPEGAPALWHHSGNHALGIKHDGRWIVFYHQGDVNDAWKTGHSGASKLLVDQAYKLGVNIIYYAFTHYSALHQ